MASVIYTTIGNESYPKERLVIIVDHGVIAIADFKELVVTGLDGKSEKLKRIEKGWFEVINGYGQLLISILPTGISAWLRNSPGINTPAVTFVWFLFNKDTITNETIESPVSSGQYELYHLYQ